MSGNLLLTKRDRLVPMLQWLTWASLGYVELPNLSTVKGPMVDDTYVLVMSSRVKLSD